MTLDEAIGHAQASADRLRRECSTRECGLEHQQLADWLRELRARRVREDRDTWQGLAAFVVCCALMAWVFWLVVVAR